MTADIFARTYGVELLCLQRPRIDEQTLLRQLELHCPGVELLQEDAASTVLSFVHPSFPIVLQDAAIAAQTLVSVAEKSRSAASLESAVTQSWDFADAREAAQQSTSAVLVTDFMSTRLDHRDRLGLFHRALRAVLEVVVCEAIYWQASDRLVDPQTWIAVFDGSAAIDVFTSGAVNVRMFKVEGPGKSGEGDTIMDTLGLGALGLPDLQCRFQQVEPKAVARVLYNTAWYTFTNGDVIDDGHTVPGVHHGSQWRCHHEDALVEPARVVLNLQPVILNAAE